MENENNPTQWNPSQGETTDGSTQSESASNESATLLQPPTGSQSSSVPQSTGAPQSTGVPHPVVPAPSVPNPSAPAPTVAAASATPPATPPVAPPVSAPAGNAQQGTPVSIEDTSPGSAEFNNNYQRFADSAGKQMEEAADAIRRGEFVRDAVVDPTADSDDRLVGLLNYVVPVLLPAIVLMSESSEKRPFQRFHAVQSLGLSAAMILIGIAVGIVSMVLGVIPVINIIAAVALFCLTPVLFLMAIVAVIYYGVQAYQGKRFAIPGVTNFLINQGWL